MKKLGLNRFKIDNNFISNKSSGFANNLQKIFYMFDNVFYIESLKNYVEFINVLLLDFYKKKDLAKIREKYIFRGFSNISQLRSKVFQNKIIKDNEFKYIRKFEENACVNLGQFNNPIDLVAAAEHYGVYTRLIDWSTSPLVATLFSLYEINEYNSEFYGVAFRNYKSSVVLKMLDENDPLQTNILSFRYANMIKIYEELISYKNAIDKNKRKKIINAGDDYFKNKIKDKDFFNCEEQKNMNNIINYFEHVIKRTNIYDSENEKKIYKCVRKFLADSSQIFIETNYSNVRLRNQRGLFQIDNLDGEFNIYKGTSLLLISSNARNEIIKYINNLGINYYLLMDDAENGSRIINKTIEGKISYDLKIEYLK